MTDLALSKRQKQIRLMKGSIDTQVRVLSKPHLFLCSTCFVFPHSQLSHAAEVAQAYQETLLSSSHLGTRYPTSILNSEPRRKDVSSLQILLTGTGRSTTAKCVPRNTSCRYFPILCSKPWENSPVSCCTGKVVGRHPPARCLHTVPLNRGQHKEPCRNTNLFIHSFLNYVS